MRETTRGVPRGEGGGLAGGGGEEGDADAATDSLQKLG